MPKKTLLQLHLLALAVLALVGCLPAPAGQAPPSPATAGTAEPVPMLVGAAPPRTPRPSGVGTPEPTASTSGPTTVRPATRTPSPSPSPTPTPQLVEGVNFRLTVPTGWKVVRTTLVPPVNVELTAEYGPGAFRLTDDAMSATLERRQAAAKAEAGTALVRSENVTVDDLRGYLVAWNAETPDGKRYVIERGFAYKGRFWKLVTLWDKRAPEAARLEADADRIVKTFLWL